MQVSATHRGKPVALPQGKASRKASCIFTEYHVMPQDITCECGKTYSLPDKELSSPINCIKCGRVIIFGTASDAQTLNSPHQDLDHYSRSLSSEKVTPCVDVRPNVSDDLSAPMSLCPHGIRNGKHQLSKLFLHFFLAFFILLSLCFLAGALYVVYWSYSLLGGHHRYDDPTPLIGLGGLYFSVLLGIIGIVCCCGVIIVNRIIAKRNNGEPFLLFIFLILIFVLSYLAYHAYLYLGREEQIPQESKQDVFSVAYSPDGKTLASGRRDGTITLWDVQTSKEKTTLKGHTKFVPMLVFSPDGEMLASGAYEGTIKLWDMHTGMERTTFDSLNDWISVAFSPDGNTLALGAKDQMIKLWNVQKGTEQATLAGRSNHSVAFSPDGKTLASGGTNELTLWDLRTGMARVTVKGKLENEIESVAYSPDGRTLASWSYKSAIINIWNTEKGMDRVASFDITNGTVSEVLYSPDSQTVASLTYHGDVTLWDVKTGKETASPKIGKEKDSPRRLVSSLAYSPDGNTLAMGCLDATIKLWDVRKGKVGATIKISGNYDQ